MLSDAASSVIHILSVGVVVAAAAAELVAEAEIEVVVVVAAERTAVAHNANSAGWVSTDTVELKVHYLQAPT